MPSTRNKTITLNNDPDVNELWKGIGGNFDNLTQILNEFIDNASSNFKASYYLEKPRTLNKIFVRIIEKKKGLYKVEVEDTGTGITNLEVALSIGDKSAGQTTLNEHGFGMKNALAAANPENDKWSIKTRTFDDVKNDEYTEIQAPYEFNQQIIKVTGSTDWEGVHQTGTIVTFYITDDLLRTIAKGLKGNYKNLDSLVEVLAEDLGYTYRTYIQEGICSLTIEYKALHMPHIVTKNVSIVEPSIDTLFGPKHGNEKLDLGNGEVEIDYEFLKVKRSNNKKHYLANMSSSGVEIRVNGRVLADNLFSEIWGIEKHNSYNYLLIRLDIKSDFSERLPSTSTNKIGLKQDDPKLEEIYKWIRKHLSKPEKEADLADDEKDLFDILMSKKLKFTKDFAKMGINVNIEREKEVFTKLGGKVRADLYEEHCQKNKDGKVECAGTVYEGKKKQTTINDVYQLIKYWDGLVNDGYSIKEGVLIAKDHPKSVKDLVKIKNQSLDINGEEYNIKLKTWQEYDINPKI